VPRSRFKHLHFASSPFAALPYLPASLPAALRAPAVHLPFAPFLIGPASNVTCRLNLWTTPATREHFGSEGITHNTVVKAYIASLSIRTEPAAGSPIASSAKPAFLEPHRSSARGHSSDEAGSQIPATTARGRSGVRCSFFVTYASDRPPRRHCLASKADFKTFLDKNNELSKQTHFPIKFDNWLVEDGAFVVSLETANSSCFFFGFCCRCPGGVPAAGCDIGC